jgi:hypothetical protein
MAEPAPPGGKDRGEDMRRLTALIALALAALGVLTAAASGGGGTGISATPAATKGFNGTYSAKFVRSASGIINETSRINTAGPQNGWSSEDVWLQFRPLTGSGGTGSPTPNSFCEGTTVIAPFVYVNDQPSLGGTPSTGYFINLNPYNVCVYFVHTYATDLSVAPNPVIQGHDVVFTSHLLVDGSPAATPPATIEVHAYDTDSTCTVEAGYGPFSTAQNGVDYTTVPLTASAAPGDYYYKAEATFATPTLTRWSACTKLTIAPHDYQLTLLADGQSSFDQVDVGHHTIYTGTATDGSYPVPGTGVSFNVWAGKGCVGGPLYSGIAGPTTDGSGNYTFDGGPDPAGVYSVESYTANATSNCVDITVGQTAAVNDVTASPSTTWTCSGGATGGNVTGSSVFWYRDQTTGDVTVQIAVTSAVASSTFDVWVEQNPGTCPPGTSTPSNPGALTTNLGGNGSVSFTFTPDVGATNFFLSLWTPAGNLTGAQVLRSIAVNI